jgi:hypothetical protein
MTTPDLSVSPRRRSVPPHSSMTLAGSLIALSFAYLS